MLKYKVLSGEYEVQVTENSFHAAALLAIRLFDLKNKSVKLAPITMITATHDGEWCVIDTQFILDEVGVKYKRLLNLHQEQESGEDSDC